MINSKFSLPQDTTSYDTVYHRIFHSLKGYCSLQKMQIRKLIRTTPEITGSLIIKRTVGICLRVLALTTPVNKIACPVFPNMVVTLCQPEDGSFVMQMRFEVAWFEERGGRGRLRSLSAMCVYFEDKIDDMKNSSCILLQKTSSFHRSSEGKLLEKCNGELRIVLCYKLKCWIGFSFTKLREMCVFCSLRNPKNVLRPPGRKHVSLYSCCMSPDVMFYYCKIAK